MYDDRCGNLPRLANKQDISVCAKPGKADARDSVYLLGNTVTLLLLIFNCSAPDQTHRA